MPVIPRTLIICMYVYEFCGPFPLIYAAAYAAIYWALGDNDRGL